MAISNKENPVHGGKMIAIFTGFFECKKDLLEKILTNQSMYHNI